MWLIFALGGFLLGRLASRPSAALRITQVGAAPRPVMTSNYVGQKVFCFPTAEWGQVVAVLPDGRRLVRTFNDGCFGRGALRVLREPELVS